MVGNAILVLVTCVLWVTLTVSGWMELAGAGPLVIALSLPGSEIAIVLAIATLIVVPWNADVPSGELAWHELDDRKPVEVDWVVPLSTSRSS